MTLTELFSGLRTYRRFLQTPVPPALLREAVDQARLAASAANAQVLRYVVVTEPATVAALQPHVKWAGYLPPEDGVPKAEERPTAFIAVVKTADAGAFSDIDVGLSVHAMTAVLWEGGVGSCLMGAIDRPAIKSLLPIAEEDELRLMVALGYPAHQSRVVPLTDTVKYALDQNRDYIVPKRDLEDVTTFL
ncbi:MAG: nitroreductase [Ruminococcaceae bacterium]|nr:nitroreductase [Oscillospiraceae bacterium]